MKHRLSVLFLALVMTLSSFAACGEEDTDTRADTTATVETQPAETNPPHNLPDIDWNGETFMIASSSGAKQFTPEEMTGEIVNDITFERNAYLMEKYNFVIQVDQDEDSDNTQEIATLVQAGEDVYDLVYNHLVYTCNNAVAGYYHDLHQVEHLNFDAPWWAAQSVEDMTIYNKMFTITSNMIPDQLRAAKIIIFNKDTLDEYSAEYPYDQVREGTWTLDALISATKGYYKDTNGDGAKDINDKYGYCTQTVQNGYLVACQTPALGRTADGGLEITIMSEKTMALVEKLYSLYYESNDTFAGHHEPSQDNYFMNVIKAGNFAYTFGKVSTAVSLREADFRYGMVPMPKWNESQEEYSVMACSNLFSIPISCLDTDFAGFIFEALSYYGYYDVLPAFYETTMQGKIADQPEDAEMLQIINDNMLVSFAYCYDNWEGFAHLFSNTCLNFTPTGGSKDLASMYKSRENSAVNRLNKILEAFS